LNGNGKEVHVNRFFVASIMGISLCAAACGSDVEADPFAAREGRSYTATIIAPTDGATAAP
jgi:hypothetical protein